ncbi:hypothetical protein LSH36_40g18026 [Paralvinella palmiformis]|uniref:Uncharacterized protein n=1 Tax=Paralvinella palmiformis TaxID=53620 RepID=A0AAD9K8E8_9ANNE|nr:hypothetical protein LSH36_40g18026 [Paralvinella palmiformis]
MNNKYTNKQKPNRRSVLQVVVGYNAIKTINKQNDILTAAHAHIKTINKQKRILTAGHIHASTYTHMFYTDRRRELAMDTRHESDRSQLQARDPSGRLHQHQY